MVGGVFEIPCGRGTHLGTIMSLYTQLSALFTPLPHGPISPPLYSGRLPPDGVTRVIRVTRYDPSGRLRYVALCVTERAGQHSALLA